MQDFLTTIVRCKSGFLQGKRSTSESGKVFLSFLGVPYAKPPLGKLRFKCPKPIKPWKKTRMAINYGPWAMQMDLHEK